MAWQFVLYLLLITEKIQKKISSLPMTTYSGEWDKYFFPINQ